MCVFFFKDTRVFRDWIAYGFDFIDFKSAVTVINNLVDTPLDLKGPIFIIELSLILTSNFELGNVSPVSAWIFSCHLRPNSARQVVCRQSFHSWYSEIVRVRQR